ncbi:MAG: sugar ABC transporter permease [Chloroflexota bacterium]
MSLMKPSPTGKSKRNRFLGLSSYGWARARWFYVFVAPWLLGLLAFTILPVSVGLLMSFSNFTGSNFQTYKWVGFANYAEAFNQFFHNGDAWYSLSRTLLFAGITIPINISLSFFIAILLTRNIRGQGIFRTLFYLPTIIPLVAGAWIFKLLFDNNFGVVNAVLNKIIPGTFIHWMTSYSFWVLIMWSVWMGVGGAIVIFMAGIQGVPTDLVDAAYIDGASPSQLFLLIILPLVTPVIFYQFVVGIIGALQVLTQPILLAQKANSSNGLSTIPPRENFMFLVNVYQQSFNQQRYGYGSALLWIMFVFILILTLVVTISGKYWVYYENEPGKN